MRNNKLVNKFVAIGFILFLLGTTGCYYFWADSYSNEELYSIENLNDVNNYYILHHNGKYALNQLTVDSLGISAGVGPINREIHYKKGRKDRYYKNKTKKHKSELSIINEVHIYIKPDIGLEMDGAIDIPYEAIEEITVIDHNSGKTVSSHVFSIIGGIVGALVITGVIVALTKDSCPYVYSDNDSTFIFEGEVFAGAIAKNLARKDFIPLKHLTPRDGSYTLRISNELKERQYTDMARLIVVNHPEDSEAFIDNTGEVHISHNRTEAIEVLTNSKQNLIDILSHKDNNSYMFNEIDSDLNSIVLKFPKQGDVNKGLLILDAKNSYWGDYISGQVFKKFGSRYNHYMHEQEKLVSEERKQRIIDRNLLLNVYIKLDNDWQLVKHIDFVGPLAKREIAIPIDLSEHRNEYVELKLETGFMFWELDYAGMSFDFYPSDKLSKLSPKTVISNDGKKWKSVLEKEDDVYMTQFEVGNITELSFQGLQFDTRENQSCFLETKGYYEPIREFEGKAKISELEKFRDASYFAQYSRAKYIDYITVDEKPIAKLNSSMSSN